MNRSLPSTFIEPDWPAPATVRAVATTRGGGESVAPYASFNLGDHVGDNADRVAANRLRLQEITGLNHAPYWLKQVHGVRVVEACGNARGVEADGSWTRVPGQACVIMTADCLPAIFCDRSGTSVAAAHAGWRGLAAGVLEATVHALPAAPDELLVWLGPAIGQLAYEVDGKVFEAFCGLDPDTASCFIPLREGHWLADLYALARFRLRQVGVTAVYGGDHCTYSDPERFFSYRRDGVTGRMATLVWLAGQ